MSVDMVLAPGIMSKIQVLSCLNERETRSLKGRLHLWNNQET